MEINSWWMNHAWGTVIANLLAYWLIFDALEIWVGWWIVVVLVMFPLNVFSYRLADRVRKSRFVNQCEVGDE